MHFFFFSLPISLAASLDLKLGARLSLQHNVRSCFTVQRCLCLYGRHKYTKSLPHSVLARGQGGFMIKTRLCLPNSEKARKIDCSYAYSAQEGSTETCTSSCSIKVDFLMELYV